MNLENYIELLKSHLLLCILLSGRFLAKITFHGKGAIFVAV